ncbi:MAG: Grx4 family monothiol glutaredoxin [Verrucomicrobiota bacterium]
MSIMEQIDNEVKQNRIMLYMKGTPNAPACGFSGTAVRLLEACRHPYKTSNVLENMEVREGVKRYSSWPTIPQLYIDGEFIGGCDDMLEMFRSGALQKKIGVPEADGE